VVAQALVAFDAFRQQLSGNASVERLLQRESCVVAGYDLSGTLEQRWPIGTYPLTAAIISFKLFSIGSPYQHAIVLKPCVDRLEVFD
jgi:hypothetical protein